MAREVIVRGGLTWKGPMYPKHYPDEVGNFECWDIRARVYKPSAYEPKFRLHVEPSHNRKFATLDEAMDGALSFALELARKKLRKLEKLRDAAKGGR